MRALEVASEKFRSVNTRPIRASGPSLLLRLRGASRIDFDAFVTAVGGGSHVTLGDARDDRTWRGGGAIERRATYKHPA